MNIGRPWRKLFLFGEEGIIKETRKLQLTAGPPGKYSVFLNFHYSISVFKVFKVFWKREQLRNTADGRPFGGVFFILEF